MCHRPVPVAALNIANELQLYIQTVQIFIIQIFCAFTAVSTELPCTSCLILRHVLKMNSYVEMSSFVPQITVYCLLFLL